jgi:hypothetical protein
MHAVASCSKSLKWRTNILAWMNDVNECHERLMMFGTAKRRKPKNSHRNRGFAVNEIQNLSESVFTRMFRLDRDSFYELAEVLDSKLHRDAMKATCSSGSPITTVTRLAVTLRWLAGGSYIDLCFAWGVSVASFYGENGVLWPTIEALDDHLKLGFPLKDEYSLSRYVSYSWSYVISLINKLIANSSILYYHHSILKFVRGIQKSFWRCHGRMRLGNRRTSC